MNTEPRISLRERAAVHAALADPARLAITDALTLGDVSSSELPTLQGMPSNLMAHHRKVLQDAGLIARARSEADRRRIYRTLVPGALGGVDVGAARSAARVVFVCTANSARSQLASALWRRASRDRRRVHRTHPAGRRPRRPAPPR